MSFRPRFSRLSLTQRLTLFFSIVAALVVLGLGTLFLVVTERHFTALDQIALQDKQHLIEKILSQANSPDDARWRLGEVLSYHESLGALVQDARGEIIFESKGFDPKIKAALPRNTESGLRVWKDRDGKFHVLDFNAAAPYDTAPLHIWIALDTQVHSRFLSGLERSLILYALAALIFCGVLSWFAARQGLAPLREMKSRAAKVTGRKLAERMPVEAVPIEMADLAQELNHMLDRLQEDFQRLTDFAVDLAHELRTPISNLLTQTQVVLATPRDAATYRDILASNAEEFQSLARMVSDMLFLAKTERGVDLPRKEVFSAHEDAAALVDFYEAVAEEQRVHLRLEGDGQIKGDRLMFRRALSNLLSNALRYTLEDGDVSIIISTTDQSTNVAVENTGPDIAPERLSRLFDRFYRTDPARARPGFDGAGLGLAITRAIARAHGGDVIATSSRGRTCFVLTFPHDGKTTPSSKLSTNRGCSQSISDARRIHKVFDVTHSNAK